MSISDFDIESLSVDEQLGLIERLWANIERAASKGDQRALTALDANGDISPELLDELHRRIEEHNRDPSTGVPWETLNEELKRKFG